ncbi:putative bifunctional UDP-N-acetylglucosamine transferase and deubiquitinase ALG13 isoform X3 [Syngnathus scovelli]|uniref:putative bifunctional UDP-N-acetylglucosamine transferase and deubiquitinase ALG13 isoform X3 n=1 Tax=Syngnathus scovelli TaxID=161590 RepID=UPI0021108AD2|nr:putative bifunctional UDP-N-acetylglucosamine transferase and deubiquitinase ALG13 isoform X3 [Syngnathus scovelli]
MQKGLKKYFVNMDDYLASLGLYRKMVARDASSLFRAVSEQLYYSQNYHHTIRQACADFMRANAYVFEPFVEGSFDKYLERLEDPKETVGQVEIKALSQLYRRRFLIYRYPGKAATVISEDDFVDKVTLSCSINGHYDIVYPRNYPASAALSQALVYELLYTKVFGCEEAELSQAAEAFKLGGRRYRNSLSACSDVDVSYDAPEDRAHREEAEAGEEKLGVLSEDVKPACDAPPPGRLCLPYKVLKSLDSDVYRNVEFDVWQDSCKEMQKMDYMVFAGRQYFLGDKCQVRLEPKGKYFNAFIQEVGTHSAAVTVFIEELGEKHLVPVTDVKAVNPVPAWNASAPPRKGDPDVDGRGHQRHQRHRYFRKSRGGGVLVKGADPAVPPTSSYGGPAPGPLPPRFQPVGRPPSAGAVPYDPYAPPHHHHHQQQHGQTFVGARASRYGTARSLSRVVNRHLVGPHLTYYPPARRYYDYDSYAFRSRRSRRHLAAAAALAKGCPYFNEDDAAEPSAEMDGAVAYYRVDDANHDIFATLTTSASVPQPQSVVASPPPSSASYRLQRGSGGPLQLSPSAGGALTCSSEEEQDADAVQRDRAELTRDFRDDFMLACQDESRGASSPWPRSQEVDATDGGYQTPSVYAGESPAAQVTCTLTRRSSRSVKGYRDISVTPQDREEGGLVDSPPRADEGYGYTVQQAVKPMVVISSSPTSSSSSSPSSSSRVAGARAAPAPHVQPRSVAVAIPAPAPWLVNELGEGLCSVVVPPPPPYSYDPNGSDLPRDCRVLQYYYNLGVQVAYISCPSSVCLCASHGVVTDVLSGTIRAAGSSSNSSSTSRRWRPTPPLCTLPTWSTPTSTALLTLARKPLHSLPTRPTPRWGAADRCSLRPLIWKPTGRWSVRRTRMASAPPIRWMAPPSMRRLRPPLCTRTKWASPLSCTCLMKLHPQPPTCHPPHPLWYILPTTLTTHTTPVCLRTGVGTPRGSTAPPPPHPTWWATLHLRPHTLSHLAPDARVLALAR